MTFQQELSSWNPFNWSTHGVGSVPEVGEQAPKTAPLHDLIPRNDKKPVIIAFLRHCGCPFAEKIFLKLREAAGENENIHYIAVSHSDKPSTEKWVKDVGGAGRVEVVVDDQREAFSAFGLGLSSFWAVLNPSSLKSAMTMGKAEGIEIRPTASGSRWQEAGLFAFDGEGKTKYSHKAQTSDDLGDLQAAMAAVEAS